MMDQTHKEKMQEAKKISYIEEFRAFMRIGQQEKNELFPVKPLKDDEEDIRSRLRQRLEPLYEKIKP